MALTELILRGRPKSSPMFTGAPFLKAQTESSVWTVDVLDRFRPLRIGYAKFEDINLVPIPAKPAPRAIILEANGFIRVDGADLGRWKVLQGVHVYGSPIQDYDLLELTTTDTSGQVQLNSVKHPQKKFLAPIENVEPIGSLVYFQARHAGSETAQKFIEQRGFIERYARNSIRENSRTREPNAMLRLSGALSTPEGEHVLVAYGILG